MQILSIDTCLRAGGVAALQNDVLMHSVFSESDEPFSSRLFKHLAELEATTGLAPADFDLYAVAHGPGSFTGVRVGVAAVKAWTELFGKRIVTVSALQAVATQVQLSFYATDAGDFSPLGKVICASLDAHRGQVFGGIYRVQPAERLETLFEGVLSPAELIAEVISQSGTASVRFASPTPGMLLLALADSPLANAPVVTVSYELAPWVGRAALRKAQNGETTNAIELDANYIRRCDAEVYWKGA